MSFLYILYAILCIPAQGFNAVSAMVSVSENVFGLSAGSDSILIWIFFAVLLIIATFSVFGGLARITRITDVLVPFMAVIYVVAVLAMVLLNLDRLPWFFYAMITEAFNPEPIFGGALGIALSQGIKRGLMSNEAGQGTLTMPAAVSDANHPCEQGAFQAIGVFLDTIIICTLTGFVVIIGRLWTTSQAESWFQLGRLEKFLASCGELLSGAGENVVLPTISVCFGVFAFTTLLGFLSFSEICAREISQSNRFITVVRFVDLSVLAFRMATAGAGFDLSALWNLSDFANIVMVCVNLPLLYVGFEKVRKAFNHFECGKDKFNTATFGESLPVWDEKNFSVRR